MLANDCINFDFWGIMEANSLLWTFEQRQVLKQQQQQRQQRPGVLRDQNDNTDSNPATCWATMQQLRLGSRSLFVCSQHWVHHFPQMRGRLFHKFAEKAKGSLRWTLRKMKTEDLNDENDSAVATLTATALIRLKGISSSVSLTRLQKHRKLSLPALQRYRHTSVRRLDGGGRLCRFCRSVAGEQTKLEACWIQNSGLSKVRSDERRLYRGKCLCCRDGVREEKNELLISEGSCWSPPGVAHREPTAAPRQKLQGPFCPATGANDLSFLSSAFSPGIAALCWHMGWLGADFCNSLLKIAGMPSVHFRRLYLYSEKVHYAIVLLRKSHFFLLGNLSAL